MAERIDGGVRIVCPTSEAVVYDGTAGVDGVDGETIVGPQGERGEQGLPGSSGQDGTSCTVTDAGLVTCTDGSSYQLPTATEADGCQVFVLPNTAQ